MRSDATAAQHLLERGGGPEEERRAVAELLAAVAEAREALEARARGLEALEAGMTRGILSIDTIVVQSHCCSLFFCSQ